MRPPPPPPQKKKEDINDNVEIDICVLNVALAQKNNVMLKSMLKSRTTLESKHIVCENTRCVLFLFIKNNTPI